jgi:hypothetical protein
MRSAALSVLALSLLASPAAAQQTQTNCTTYIPNQLNCTTTAPPQGPDWTLGVNRTNPADAFQDGYRRGQEQRAIREQQALIEDQRRVLEQQRELLRQQSAPPPALSSQPGGPMGLSFVLPRSIGALLRQGRCADALGIAQTMNDEYMIAVVYGACPTLP